MAIEIYPPKQMKPIDVGAGVNVIYSPIDSSVVNNQNISVDITENGVQQITFDREQYTGIDTVTLNVDVDSTNNQEKVVNIDSNGQTLITPDANHTGISAVLVKTNVQPVLESKSETFTENGDYTIAPIDADGLQEVNITVNVDVDTPYEEGKEEGTQEQKSKLTSATFSTNGTYTRADGWNSVVVNVDTETPYEEGKAEGVEEQKSKLSSTMFSSNGTYTRANGWNEVIVSVPSEGTPSQQKTATYTANGNYSILPDNGYAISRADISVNVDVTTPYNEGVQDQKDKLTELTITSNGDYSREDGYSAVHVNVPSSEATPTQIKTATYTSNGSYTVLPDTGYALSQVEVSVNVSDYETYQDGYDDGYAAGQTDGYDEGYQDGIDHQKDQLSSTTITANGTYTRADGWNSVVVNVNTQGSYESGYSAGYAAGREAGYAEGYSAGYTAGVNYQKGLLASTTITTNGTYTREDGWNSVVVNVAAPSLEEKTVNPRTTLQEVTSTRGGLSKVIVNPVTSSIDSNIKASNIKSGVTILGVTGTLQVTNYDAIYNRLINI